MKDFIKLLLFPLAAILFIGNICAQDEEIMDLIHSELYKTKMILKYQGADTFSLYDWITAYDFANEYGVQKMDQDIKAIDLYSKYKAKMANKPVILTFGQEFEYYSIEDLNNLLEQAKEKT